MSILQLAQSAIARITRLNPFIGLRMRLALERRYGEPELRLVGRLADRSRMSIDVGANRGIYSGALLPVSRAVVAIEPNPQLAADVRRAWPGVRVECCAIAAEEGVATLRLPIMANGAIAEGYATLGEFAEHFERETSIEVPVRTLDSFGFEDVGFIKIDVEGLEDAVLEGAAQTIERWRPNLIVEINGAPTAWTERLAPLGYTVSFWHDGKLRPVGEWSPALETRNGRAPNNFVFTAS